MWFGGNRISPLPVIMANLKLLAEYLEPAVSLERLAADELYSQFKNDLLGQAVAYRRLAKRAREYGLPPPSPPQKSN